MKSVRVTVPASTSNLGPGFDVIGLAVTLRNEITLQVGGRFRPRGKTEVFLIVEGLGADTLPQGRRNLVAKVALDIFRQAGKVPERLDIRAHNRIPLASGLGSSASAIVGGMIAANELCGRPFTQKELLKKAVRLEGHPDNVAPALLGGLTLCVADDNGELHVLQPPIRKDLTCIFCVPDMAMPTKEARRILPTHYSRAQAVFSLSRAVMLTALLQRGSEKLFRVAMQDRLHQPYRSKLLPGMNDAISAAQAAGAAGACLSGSGPTLLAITAQKDSAGKIAAAMQRAYRRAGLDSQAFILAVSPTGARVSRKA